MSLTVVADENIPGLEQISAPGLNLQVLPGREITSRHLRQADALLVRSVTRVDADLLDGSPVRFVGTATSGLDHVDQHLLQRRSIGFAAAPGANADSVVDYVFSTLAVMAIDQGLDWLDSRIGVVGAGQVGGRLLRRLSALGVETRVCDPYVATASLPAPGSHCDIGAVLDCPVVTLHTPLTRGGEHPTHHLLDATRLSWLRHDQLLINAARGAVVDNEALLATLQARPAIRVALDTWEDEPAIDTTLLQKVRLATPHIAGYSLDGKWRATRMIVDALRRHFGLDEPRFDTREEDVAVLDAPLPQSGETRSHWLSRCILGAYDVRLEDRRMRTMSALSAAERRVDFDRQRRDYPVRREFSHFAFAGGLSDWQVRALRALGFTLPQP